MRSPRLLLLLPVAVFGLAAAGCTVGDDGPSTTQTRDVSAFTRVDNDASVDVRLRVGRPQRVVVRAGEKVIDDVSTEVRDGTLVVRFDHDGWGGNDVDVEATVPRLNGLSSSGSGDIDATGIDAAAFEVFSNGSSDVSLDGTAERLVVEVDGSGDVDLANLAARHARVVVDGSGDLELRADERLDVTVDGSGDVRYHGSPQVSQHVDGSGDLSRAG